MALSAEDKKLLNNATPGLHKAGLGDIIDEMLKSQLHAGGNATTEAAGLMSAADKTKLDGVAASANNYTLPNATTSVRGGVKMSTLVADAAGSNPTKAEFDALLAAMKTAGLMSAS